jgi:hypothetical protein
MEGKPQIIRTGIRMNANTHKLLTTRLREIRYRAGGRKMSIDAAINQAVLQWLGHPPPEPVSLLAVPDDLDALVRGCIKFFRAPLKNEDLVGLRECVEKILLRYSR